MRELKSNDFMKKNENLNIFRQVFDKRELWTEHTHSFIEIVYIYDGSGYQTVNGVTYSVERGDLIFLNIGDIHAHYTNEKMGIINLFIDPDFFHNEIVKKEISLDIFALTCYKEYNDNVNCIPPRVKFFGKKRIEIETFFDLMMEEFDAKTEGYLFALKGYINILLPKIIRIINTDTHVNMSRKFNKITPEMLQIIRQNYNKKVNLKELAHNSYYTPAYFSKIFKECFGKNVTEYINEIRISEAIKLMQETSQSIENIAHTVGYKSKKHFYKNFKLQTGMTPSQYKDIIIK